MLIRLFQRCKVAEINICRLISKIAFSERLKHIVDIGNNFVNILADKVSAFAEL